MARGRNRDKHHPVPQNAQSQQIQVSASASYSGLLPPPEMLARYNDAVENGAERIVRLVENQSAHRIELENKALDADIGRGKLGLRAGIALMLMAFGLGGYLVYANDVMWGVIVVCVTVAFIGGAFIYGTASQRQERKERVEILAGRRPN